MGHQGDQQQRQQQARQNVECDHIPVQLKQAANEDRKADDEGVPRSQDDSPAEEYSLSRTISIALLFSSALVPPVKHRHQNGSEEQDNGNGRNNNAYRDHNNLLAFKQTGGELQGAFHAYCQDNV